MSLYVQGFVVGLVLGVIFWFAFSEGAAVLVFLGAMVVAVLVGWVRRVFVRYTITDQRLRIQRGIISRNIQQTRIDRVQNVTTRQSVMDRLFRVGSVDFDTAGTDDSNFIFAGVNDPQRVVAAVAEAQRASAAQQPEGTPPATGV